MEFEKSSEDTSMTVGEPLLTSSSLSLSEETSMDPGLKVVAANIYNNSRIETVKCVSLSSHDTTPNNKEVTEVPTSMPIYFFQTSDVGTESEFSVSVDDASALEFKEQLSIKDFKDIASNFKDATFPTDVSEPLTYYTSDVTENAVTFAIVEKPDSSTESGANYASGIDLSTNDLSEEMIRSFVVGGHLSSRSHPASNDAGASIASEQQTCTVAVITNNLCEAQTLASEEKNNKKQIVIVTESDSDNIDVDKLLNESEHVETTGTQFGDSSSGSIDMQLGDFSSSDERKITVTLLQDKSDEDMVYSQGESPVYQTPAAQSYSENKLSAEELLESHPVLHMEFQVETEISSLDGVILKREVTTQTKPLLRPRVINRRKLKRKLSDESDVSTSRHLKCSKCNIRFADPEILEAHTKCHSADKSYVCYECGFVQTQWVKMYHHLFGHGLAKPFKCSQCSFCCLNRSDLATHMFVHSTTKEWTCEKCDRLFKHRRNKVAHERACQGLDELGKPKKMDVLEECICKICNKKLSNKRNLEKHMEIHLDVKPYVCNICGHSTRLKESLTIHTRLHTGEKPFKCDQCPYSTPDKSSLRRHKRRHSNDKPYHCTSCDYKAIQKHCLDTHIRRKHTGERFVCGLCRYVTYDRYGLNQHFKQHQYDGSSVQPEFMSVAGGIISNVVAQDPKVAGDDQTKTFLPIEVRLVEVAKGDDDASQSAGAAAWNNRESTENVHMTKTRLADPTNSDEVADVAHTEHLGEGTVLQQIQGPGDILYLQTNGELLIKKPNGQYLIIQQQNDGHDGELTVATH